MAKVYSNPNNPLKKSYNEAQKKLLLGLGLVMIVVSWIIFIPVGKPLGIISGFLGGIILEKSFTLIDKIHYGIAAEDMIVHSLKKYLPEEYEIYRNVVKLGDKRFEIDILIVKRMSPIN